MSPRSQSDRAGRGHSGRRTGSRNSSPAAADSRPPTPRQGYESESEIAGTTVSPPSGAELVGALAELAGEIAQSGLSAGGRLLKGALSRLSS